MKRLRELHLYLGCIFAPALIFFAVTGSWQLFSLHKGRKDGSYSPPSALVVLSEVHLSQHLQPTSSHRSTPLRYFMLAAAIGLVTTTLLGIIMAFRYSRNSRTVILCLVAGVAVPAAMVLIFR